ncbi:DUF397 domain-containing protein [Micromonospora sp. NPDC126480]|uniref:DUF397 domain-containing protein n=1 Tax=Micromonospora sp. NPDC126480 TaxID=3155312 RepID=UPI0033292A6E
MERIESLPLLWTRRSSKCANDHCVIVSRHRGGVVVFDSTAPDSVLSFSDSSWQSFLLTLRNNAPGIP